MNAQATPARQELVGAAVDVLPGRKGWLWRAVNHKFSGQLPGIIHHRSFRAAPRLL